MKFRASHPINFSELKFFQIFALFFGLGILAYRNALFYPFVHDDIVFIQQNPHIAALTHWGEVFHSQSSSLAIANPYWRPVLEAVYRLQYQVFGLHPSGYHFVNICIHVLNANLVYYCLKNILGRFATPFIVAVVFLLHPVQSEAVACISGISNLLYAFFGLLSFWLYLRSSTILSLIIYALALLTKEQAIVFPFLILFYEYCFQQGLETRAVTRFLKFGGFFLV